MSAERRLQNVQGHISATPEHIKQLKGAQQALREFINAENCNPILVRLAWHDSGTYDARVKEWPACGGANGSIRFKEELGHGANAGLVKAVNYLKPIKEQFPLVSWADLIQMASATAIELAGGPKIPMRYGRLDVTLEKDVPREGGLPDAGPPYGDKSPDAATHLRNVFGRMGFSDREIVALSGAHTLGRAFKERSGTVEEGYGAKAGTKYTSGEHNVRHDQKPGVGMPGGRSWTESWLKFDNSYYKYIVRKQNDPESQKHLLWLATDKALHNDSEFAKAFHLYAEDNEAFLRDYAAAHLKLSELGSKFSPPEGIRI